MARKGVRASLMYVVCFCHKLDLTCLMSFYTMYKVYFSHKLGPTYLVILLHAREGEERGNHFYFYMVDHKIEVHLRFMDKFIFLTMYKMNHKQCHLGFKVCFFTHCGCPNEPRNLHPDATCTTYIQTYTGSWFDQERDRRDGSAASRRMIWLLRSIDRSQDT